MTAQALGEFVDTLGQAGYVEVVADPADRRVRVVRLTDRGLRVAQAMTATVQRMEKAWQLQYGEGWWTHFRQMLTSLGSTEESKPGRKKASQAQPGDPNLR